VPRKKEVKTSDENSSRKALKTTTKKAAAVKKITTVSASLAKEVSITPRKRVSKNSSTTETTSPASKKVLTEAKPLAEKKPRGRKKTETESQSEITPTKKIASRKRASDKKETAATESIAPVAKKSAARKIKVEAVSKPVIKKSARPNISSSETKPRARKITVIKKLPVEAKDISVAPDAKSPLKQKEVSPIFELLAEPQLPQLPSEDRARLQLQSPNRIFFYWSFRGQPYETLRKILGRRAEGFFLAVKLTELSSKNEIILPVDTSGSWWFDVESDSSYRAEIGFRGEKGAFVRLLFSNIIKTPRTSPSPRRAESKKFGVTSKEFARALHVSGYTQDAYEVASSVDADTAADLRPDIYERIFGRRKPQLSLQQENELRLALFALAAGQSLEEIRKKISKKTFELLMNSLGGDMGNFETVKIRRVLEEEFDFGEEDFSPAVYGASRINFPRKRKIAPVSSFSRSSKS